MKKNDAYWWIEAPLATMEQVPVPPSADAVIVGGGYTGLSAALRLARAGRSVQVFDSRHPGDRQRESSARPRRARAPLWRAARIGDPRRGEGGA
jgi:glycine/D-amino acid oxidase-like deaminating enzyme